MRLIQANKKAQENERATYYYIVLHMLLRITIIRWKRMMYFRILLIHNMLRNPPLAFNYLYYSHRIYFLFLTMQIIFKYNHPVMEGIKNFRRFLRTDISHYILYLVYTEIVRYIPMYTFFVHKNQEVVKRTLTRNQPLWLVKKSSFTNFSSLLIGVIHA